MTLSCCKKLCALFWKVASKYDGDFYCLNCFHSFSTENKLKEHENVCENHDYCYIEIPKKESILTYNHGGKSVKVPFIIFADMVSLLNKIYTCHNNSKKSSVTKKINRMPLVIPCLHIVHLMLQKQPWLL